MSCKNPNHKQDVKNFVKKYPTAKSNVPNTIIMIDPKYLYISDNPKENTTRCCRVCSIPEDIRRAMNRTNSYPNRYHVKYASMVDCLQDYEPSVRIVILEAHVFFNQSFLCYIRGCGWFVCVFI